MKELEQFCEYMKIEIIKDIEKKIEIENFDKGDLVLR